MTREQARNHLAEWLDKKMWRCFGTIDREAISIAVEALQAVPNCQKCAIKELWEETEKEDLVAVVRCKDCRHANKSMFCSVYLQPRLSSDFCNYGERRK